MLLELSGSAHQQVVGLSADGHDGEQVAQGCRKPEDAHKAQRGGPASHPTGSPFFPFSTALRSHFFCTLALLRTASRASCLN